jgi:hypothetical protein
MHSAIVVINMPERHESEGHHPKWLAYLADLSRACEPMVSSLATVEARRARATGVWRAGRLAI